LVVPLRSLWSWSACEGWTFATQARLWDAKTGVMRKEFIGHKKGIMSVAYQEEFRFFITAGFDRFALVWNPFVEQAVFKLHGHTNPLVKVVVVPGTPKVVTVDVERVVKVWDCQHFRCLQTFDLNEGRDDEKPCPLTDMCFVPRLRRIMLAEKVLQCMDYDLQGMLTTTDAHPVLCATYNVHSNTILTAAGANVSVRGWGVRRDG
jgi:WD40 repeat protein